MRYVANRLMLPLRKQLCTVALPLLIVLLASGWPLPTPARAAVRTSTIAEQYRQAKSFYRQLIADNHLASERRMPFNEHGIFRHYPELDD